jgi:hypothetical protein
MKTELERIIDLQPEWSYQNTAEMKERGHLIRSVGPDWLRSFSKDIAQAMDVPEVDFIANGSDGTGLKTEVPWFRFADQQRSRSATIGWYCVYLFDTRGEGVYFTLCHGSTVWTGGDFRTRPHDELRKLSSWGREQVEHLVTDRSDLISEISLHSRRSDLGPAYEASVVLGKHYSRHDLPDEHELTEDVHLFAKLLGHLYAVSDGTQPPGESAPEVVDALESASRAAGKFSKPNTGAGFRVSAKQRKVVELHAMKCAVDYLVSLGYTDIRDTSANKPYDLTCKSGQETLYVEIKGTTSDGSTLILTRGEVEHHRKVFPLNGLIVVSEIVLQGESLESARGGKIDFTSPWDISGKDLKVISYQYSRS